MTLKTIIAGIALSSTLILAGPAFAATNIGGVSVSDSDLAAIKERCAALTGGAVDPSTTTTVDADSTSGAPVSLGDANSNEKDSKVESTEGDSSKTGVSTATSFDLTTVTTDTCKEAGFTN